MNSFKTKTGMASIFRKYDAGKAKRMKGDVGDCQVRALHTASGLSYDAAWDVLYALQGKYRTQGFNITFYLDKGELGVVKRFSFPSKAGESRMTPAEFVKKHRKGNFILHQAHHVVAVEDGIVYDSWDCTHRCVYGAWEVRSNGGRAVNEQFGEADGHGPEASSHEADPWRWWGKQPRAE